MKPMANIIYILWIMERKKALTSFTSSIKSPQVNANGGKVVFEKDYQLWLYDVKAGKEVKLDIAIIAQ